MEKTKIELLRLYVTGKMIVTSFKDESGQDLIEYALVCALVAFGAVAGMNTLANGINNAFTNISTTLTTSA